MADATPTATTETIAACRVRVARGGTGAPLLFLHGAGGAEQWEPFLAALARRHHVIAPEHPGFGASDTPEWLTDVGDLAYFYLDLLERLELDQVHLVGHSLGGWIAAELAVRDDARLASLSLIAPAGIRVIGVQTGDIFLWKPQETVRNLFHDPSFAEAMLARPPTEVELAVILKNRAATAQLAWSPRLYNPQLAPWLHRIGVPTHILWGDSDKVIPPAHGSAYRDLIPGARLGVIEQCGHLPHIEKYETVVSAIADFTGANRGPRAGRG